MQVKTMDTISQYNMGEYCIHVRLSKYTVKCTPHIINNSFGTVELHILQLITINNPQNASQNNGYNIPIQYGRLLYTYIHAPFV